MRKQISKLIRTKCNLCYRKEAKDFPCLLLKDRHPGIENCIGPFQNHDEHQKIMHEIFEMDKNPEADIDRAIGDAMKSRYERNKKLFDEETNEDDKKGNTSLSPAEKRRRGGSSHAKAQPKLPNLWEKSS